MGLRRCTCTRPPPLLTLNGETASLQASNKKSTANLGKICFILGDRYARRRHQRRPPSEPRPRTVSSDVARRPSRHRPSTAPPPPTTIATAAAYSQGGRSARLSLRRRERSSIVKGVELIQRFLKGDERASPNMVRHLVKHVDHSVRVRCVLCRRVNSSGVCSLLVRHLAVNANNSIRSTGVCLGVLVRPQCARPACTRLGHTQSTSLRARTQRSPR